MLIQSHDRPCSRRDLLRIGVYGLGVTAAMPALFERVSLAQTAGALGGGAEKHPSRILIVLELGGGNDGLNTVVPYAQDAYYKARPLLAIKKNDVLKLNDEFGFHPACEGMHGLFKEGKLAIVHGCSYPNPNLSHFTAMEWWHTAMPHGSDPYGWLGRFADANRPDGAQNYVVNIAPRQSLAVSSAKHSPVVFKDPKKFARVGDPAQQQVFEEFGRVYPTSNGALRFVNTVSQTATSGAAKVREACAKYRTPVDYGSGNELAMDLKKVAALIHAGLPTRIFYVGQGGYDTHAAQTDAQNLLLVYLADALRGFMEDLERIKRADDVAIMIFTEFGRRVGENASRGTDHGTATPMVLVGKPVKGGFYGTPPSLTDLDNGNLKGTTDFRSVYATMLKEWMGYGDVETILRGTFPTLGVFG